jgi:hypothetical protein
MAVATDILASYRRPRPVFRRRLANGVDEGRSLSILIVACALIFASQWPGIARAAYLDPAIPLDARMGGALIASMFMLPLIAYALAATSHLVARLFGGQGSFGTARLALFWALLAVSPLMLLQGLVRGFVGPGPGLTVTGVLVMIAFGVFWGVALREAERAEWT